MPICAAARFAPFERRPRPGQRGGRTTSDDQRVVELGPLLGSAEQLGGRVGAPPDGATFGVGLLPAAPGDERALGRLEAIAVAEQAEAEVVIRRLTTQRFVESPAALDKFPAHHDLVRRRAGWRRRS